MSSLRTFALAKLGVLACAWNVRRKSVRRRSRASRVALAAPVPRNPNPISLELYYVYREITAEQEFAASKNQHEQFQLCQAVLEQD